MSNPDNVIQLAKKGSDKARVYSFGVGYGCSKYLVKEIAKAGRGSYSFVDEKSENLKGKVISALRKAVEPSLKGCSFSYITESGAPILESPFAGVIGEAFRNEPINQFLILNRTQFEQLRLQFKCKEDPVTKTAIEHSFESGDFKMLEPGDFLFKLAAKSRVKELQELIQGSREAPIDVPKTVEDIVKISVRY